MRLEVLAPVPSHALRDQICQVQRDGQHGREARNRESAGKERHSPAAECRHEHQSRLLVAVHVNAVRAERQRCRDQDADGDESSKCHTERRDDTVRRNVLERPFVFYGARRIEIEHVRLVDRSNDADRDEPVLGCIRRG